MNKELQVLLVEDEKNITNFITAILNANGYSVIKAGNARAAEQMASSKCPDLILLDLGLPDKDGMKVLKEIRQWSDTPLVVVSARTHERDKVEALDLGADDYVTKPFGTSELLARMRTALRHRRKDTALLSEVGKVVLGELIVDYEKRRVWVGSREVRLTPVEYKIICLLSRYPGKVLTHDFIIKEIWGFYNSENQLLRVNMANIRRKLEDKPTEPKFILTELGVGYRMADLP